MTDERRTSIGYINMPAEDQSKHARLDESATEKKVYRGMLAHGCPVNILDRAVPGEEYEGNDRWCKVYLVGYIHSSLMSDEYVPWADGSEAQGEANTDSRNIAGEEGAQ